MYDKIEDLADVVGGVTQPPETRLSKILGDVEHCACSTVKNGEILVFGHTHHPFINQAENVVNSGAWVTDSPVHNTVVELSGGKPRLAIFEGREITERIAI
jgi:predicted phosphodiesterase